MRPILCLCILLASRAWADEAADRAAIEKTVHALNTAPLSRELFTADFHDFNKLAPLRLQGGGGAVVISHEPWGEATWYPILYPRVKLRVVIRSIRFITPVVAHVRGIDQSDEDTSPTSQEVVLVLKKEGVDWRIASFRVLAPAERGADPRS